MSVFKIIQELMAPSKTKGQTQFQVLLSMLPETHKASGLPGPPPPPRIRPWPPSCPPPWPGSTPFSIPRWSSCCALDTAVDAETFCKEKSALFLVMPEEDPSKFFMVSLIIQQLYREILSVADEKRREAAQPGGVLL